jgi:outer membrane protein TolC
LSINKFQNMTAGDLAGLLLTLILLLLTLPAGGRLDLRPQSENPIPNNLPEKFSLYNQSDSIASPWWLSFDDQELSQLINSGLTGNLSLQEGWARLKQAQATAVQAGATLYPSVAADCGAAHQRPDNSDNNSRHEDSFSVGLSTSYELELWGRVRAKAEGAVRSANAAGKMSTACA